VSETHRIQKVNCAQCKLVVSITQQWRADGTALRPGEWFEIRCDGESVELSPVQAYHVARALNGWIISQGLPSPGLYRKREPHP